MYSVRQSPPSTASVKMEGSRARDWPYGTGTITRYINEHAAVMFHDLISATQNNSSFGRESGQAIRDCRCPTPQW